MIAGGMGAGTARRHARAIAAVAIALPLIVAATAVGLRWIGAAFPGFFVLADGVIPTIGTLEWPADRRAVFHAQVVLVDGEPVASNADVYAVVARHAPGTAIEYTLQRAGTTTSVTLPVRRFGVWDWAQTFGVLLVFGTAWLVCGLTVSVLQPASVQARAFLLQSVIAGLYPVTAVFLYQPGHPWLGRLSVILECLLGATWIHLALVFPVDRRLRGWRWLVVGALYALGAALGTAVLLGLALRPPWLAPLYAEYSFAAAGLAAFVLALIVGYRANPGGVVRPRIAALLPGALLAGPLAVFALLNSVVAGRDFPAQFGLLLSPLFSAAMAYAIVKRDLFDVDRVVRQSFGYAVLTLLVVVAYGLTLLLASQAVTAVPQAPVLLSLAFVAALAVGLDPVRAAVQRLVDRTFFRLHLDYRATVSAVGEALSTLLHRDDIVAELTRVATDVLALERVGLVLLDPCGAATLWTRSATGPVAAHTAPLAAVDLARAVEAAGGTALRGDALARIDHPASRETVAALLTDLAGHALVALNVQRRVIGYLVLGRKRSGRMLSSDDITLLRTLANQAAIALQNAASYQALEALTRELDSTVQERTAALRASNRQLGEAYDELKQAQAQIVQAEKMASLGQLVAGVAHEINNPASFVHGGLQNLALHLERLLGLLEAYERVPLVDPVAAAAIARARAAARVEDLQRDTPTLLRICAEGSERIKKIVEDMRMFVRADQGDRVPMDVAPSLDQALRLLGDRIERGGVTVQRDYRAVPPLAANAGQLNQVWTNLLSNALDAVEGLASPTISLTLRSDADASPTAIEVEVRDNGVGMTEQTRARAFEPFFTTKPVGRGTGLGLSIVFGAVKSHGGTIDVESSVGRGTAVRLSLPLR